MAYFQPRTKTNLSAVPFVSRPADRQTFLVFTSEQNGFEALVHLDVRTAIAEKAERASPNETIGLLAGRILRDERGPYTLVLSSEGAWPDELEASPSHVRLSANGQAQVRNRLEASAYGLDIIGWYHSHPRFSARFSSEDLVEQSTWRDPNHIGIVISGIDHASPLGLYRGPQAILLTSPPPAPPQLSRLPVALHEISAPTVSAPNQSRMPEIWRTMQRVTAGVVPVILLLAVLGVVLTLVRINERVVRLETAHSSGSALHDPPVTRVTGNPVAPPSPEDHQVPDSTAAVLVPDPVNKQTTKPPIAPSSPKRQLNSNANKRGAAVSKSSSHPVTTTLSRRPVTATPSPRPATMTPSPRPVVPKPSPRPNGTPSTP